MRSAKLHKVRFGADQTKRSPAEVLVPLRATRAA